MLHVRCIADERQKIWSKFVEDYLPTHFYFLHLWWGLVLSLTVMNEFVDPGPLRSTITIALLLTFIAAMLKLKPFRTHQRWKMPV